MSTSKSYRNKHIFNLNHIKYNNYYLYLPRQAASEFLIHYWLRRMLCLDFRYWCFFRGTGNQVDQVCESGSMH